MILVNDLIETFLEAVSRHSWYCLVTLAGLFFRVEVETNNYLYIEQRIQKVIKNIATLMLLTVLWGGSNQNTLTENAEALLLVLTMVYILRNQTQSSACLIGHKENALMIIKNLTITFLSFQPPLNALIGIPITIGIAYVFYKLLDEDRSDFIEIIMLCFEGIAISVMMEHSSMNALITVVVYVFFVETVLYSINYLIKKFLSSYFGEDDH